MSRRPSDKNRNPKPVQLDALPDAHRKDNDQIIEMAAEQLADLLWRHWLYIKKLEEKNSKEPDS